MPLESDAVLLQRFRRGETEALAQVFREHLDDVAGTLRAGVVVVVDGQRVRVGANLPETEVEVLIQDTFVRAFAPRARDAYDGLRPYGAYLATIARNLLIDRTRGLRRASALVSALSVDEANLPSGEAGPSEQAEENEIAGVLAAVQDGLTAREVAIYRHRYVDELSLRDTAAALGLPLITVRRVDVRLRERILAALRAAGYLLDSDVVIPNQPRPRRDP